MEDEVWKKKKPPMPIGKIERDQWNIKMLEEKLKALKDGKPVQRDKTYHVDGSRLTQDVFNSKVPYRRYAFMVWKILDDSSRFKNNIFNIFSTRITN